MQQMCLLYPSSHFDYYDYSEFVSGCTIVHAQDRTANSLECPNPCENNGGFIEKLAAHLSTSKIIFVGILHYTYSGRGKFMPLPLKSKILETPGFLVTDYIKMFPL